MQSSSKKEELSSVAIITDPNNLALSLASKLKKYNCRVKIYSEISDEFVRSSYDYLFFIRLNQESIDQRNSKFIHEDFKKLISIISTKIHSKVVFIFPFTLKRNSYKEIEDIKNRLLNKLETEFTILYLGDLVGKKTNIKRENYLGKLLVEAAFENKVKLLKYDFNFYPLSVSSAVRQIIKNLFSFGFLGREAAIISSGISQTELIKIVEKYKGKIEVKRKYINDDYQSANTKGKIIIKQNLEKLILDKLSRIASTPQKKPSNISKTQTVRKILNKNKDSENFRNILLKRITQNNWFAKAALILLTLYLLPNLLLGVGIASQQIAWNYLKKGNSYISLKLFGASKNLSVYLNNSFGITKGFYPKNVIVFPPKKAAEILILSSDAGFVTLQMLEEFNRLFDMIVGEESNETESLTSNISINLENLYRNSGFLESETNQISGYGKNVFTKLVLGERGDFLKKKGPQLIRILQETPELMGGEKEKRYLIVLQNNMNLRPSGGVIESLAFITVADGKIINVEVSTSEEIDKNLKGFVPAPPAITKYYKIDGWSLKDSNWEPDYPSSAEQIEWFIDKEIDRRVDGVLAIDVDFASELLKIIGPIRINNIEIEIDAGNLQANTAVLDENNLWDDFLGEIIEKIIRLNSSDRIKFMLTVFDNFEEKHLQLFLHNKDAGRAVSELNWDGSLPKTDCYGNCLVDWVSFVESSTTENNSSVFIKRTADLKITFEEGLIKRRYVVLLENSAGADKNLIYSSYVRLVTSLESGFSPVLVKEFNINREVVPDTDIVSGHKEAGVFVEIRPGTSVTIQFEWESPNNLDLNNSGEYNFFLRKQPGIKVFPTNINIDVKDEVNSKDFLGVLTNDQNLEYNTKLSRDLVSRIYW